MANFHKNLIKKAYVGSKIMLHTGIKTNRKPFDLICENQKEKDYSFQKL